MMAWGVDFTTDIYLSRQDYQNNPGLVQDKIDELAKDLTHIESMLKMYAAASPNVIAGEEWRDEPIRRVNILVDDLLESYRETLIQSYQLSLYLEHLNAIEKAKEND